MIHLVIFTKFDTLFSSEGVRKVFRLHYKKIRIKGSTEGTSCQNVDDFLFHLIHKVSLESYIVLFTFNL